MKSISCIVGVFILGLLGWLGFEKKEPKKENEIAKEILYENDLIIRQKERECESLKMQIIDNHAVIESKINE